MWPWRKPVEAVLISSAGDDATAALTMILRHHGKRVTVDEVHQAIYEGRTEANAGDVIRAAEQFHLRVRGLGIDQPALFATLPMPHIAHVMPDHGQFPREIRDLAGYFAVVTAASPERVRWINPYEGPSDDTLDEFCLIASGVVLVFDEPSALPRATLRR